MAARAATEGARSRLGQTVVIDNKPGANSSLGVEAVLRAPKDQHTFLIASDSVSLLPLFRATPWDLSKSFIPVTLLSIQPMVLPKNETMKRTASTLALTSAIACLGLPLVATQACAQDTVTVYGRVVSSLNEVNTGGNSTVRGLRDNASRLGFRGREDLGGGESAFFRLEFGFSMNTGGLGDPAFRNSFFGLGGAWGSLALGAWAAEGTSAAN